MKEQYIREVEKLLPLPRQAKREVLRDLEEAFDSAKEHGETEEEVIRRLGTPEEFVKSLDEQLGFHRFDEFRRQKRQIWGIAGTFIFSMLCFALYAVHKALGVQRAIEGIIGGADGPTAIFVTTTGPDISFWTWALGVAALIAAVILLVRYIFKHKKGS